MEDPKLAKGVVRREVTRVLSPGTAVDPGLGAEQSNWLAALATVGSGAGGFVGLALLDLSTGEFRATEFGGAGGWALAIDELGRVRPVELLYGAGGVGLPGSTAGLSTSLPPQRAGALVGDPGFSPQRAGALVGDPGLRFGREDNGVGGGRVGGSRTGKGQTGESQTGEGRTEQASGGGSVGEDGGIRAGMEAIRTKTPMEDWVFTAEYAVPLLKQHLKVLTLDGVGLGGHEAAAVAAGAMLEYLRRTKQGALEHVDGVRFYERSTSLEVDAVSVRNLELVEPLFAGEGSHTTLFWTMDACVTPMGRRLLRSTLLRPASVVGEIGERLDAVGEAVRDLRRREELRRSMEGVLDLERLLGRVALDSAGPREVMALAATMARLPGVRAAVATCWRICTSWWWRRWRMSRRCRWGTAG